MDTKLQCGVVLRKFDSPCNDMCEVLQLRNVLVAITRANEASAMLFYGLDNLRWVSGVTMRNINRGTDAVCEICGQIVALQHRENNIVE